MISMNGRPPRAIDASSVAVTPAEKARIRISRRSNIGAVTRSSTTQNAASRTRWRPATILDSIGGAVVNVAAVLLVAWIIGSFVAYSPFTMIDRQVNNSIVLRAVDRVVPQASLSQDFSPLRSLLASGPYTQVFGAIGAESPLAVAPPDPRLVSSRGLDLAAHSVQ